MKQLFIVALLSASALASFTVLAGQDSVQLYQKQRFIDAKLAAAKHQANLETCFREHSALMRKQAASSSSHQAEEAGNSSSKQDSHN